MNTAAAFAYTAVMLIGLAALAFAVHRDRRHTRPRLYYGGPTPDGVPPIPLIFTRLAPASIYADTVDALGDPALIDFTPPAFAWPA